MAKTFDNISEASATNYLFLFSQRTLALQDEPPTPPPLNALGLPCKGMYLLWECWAQKQKQKVKHAEAAATCDEGDSGGDDGEGGGSEGSVEEEKTSAEAKAAEDGALKAAEADEEDAEVDAARKAAGDALKAAITAAEAAEAADDPAVKSAEGAAAAEGGAAASEQQEDTKEIDAATANEANDKAHSPNHDDPLAKKITEYILDNQDDAAQEERWRTTMKRETMKRFRELRDTQRETIAEVQREYETLSSSG